MGSTADFGSEKLAPGPFNGFIGISGDFTGDLSNGISLGISWHRSGFMISSMEHGGIQTFLNHYEMMEMIKFKVILGDASHFLSEKNP